MPIQPKKALGQHFLHNTSIAHRIVDALLNALPDTPSDTPQETPLNSSPDVSLDSRPDTPSDMPSDAPLNTRPDTPTPQKTVPDKIWPVLEVGPGTGVLTDLLLQDPAVNYYGVELDRRAADYLRKAYPQLKGKLICDDFLTLPPDALPEHFALIGNFPYNISSQIFFKVLELKDRIPLVVGMLQKEVAERFCSPPGSRAYGILSVLLQTWYTPEYLFTVAPGAFTPPPKVQSGVIRLVRNDRTVLDCPEDLYLKVIKTAFNQRRKMLSNSLKPLLKDLPRDSTQQDNTSIDGLHRRPEQLGVEDFIALTSQIAAL